MSFVKENFNLRPLSGKGAGNVDYYLYKDVHSINDKKVLTVYPISNTIYFGVAVSHGGDIYLTFDGSTLYVQQYTLSGYVVDKLSIPALSGVKSSNGTYALDPLPNGKYKVNHGRERKKSEKHGGFFSEGIGFTFDVIPLFTTLNGKKMERTDLRIHPDGNVPGSAGCIALTASNAVLTSFYKELSDYIAKKGSVALSVNDPKNPNVMSNTHIGKKNNE
ncbi:hypothetical protein MUGA111182_15000 [Mucilaginibacter galii]|uniref:YkuD domain-containing protein n=1 Tax=Mucilaginibacter galii TaxID=2005073 RepID=A0A917J7M3_9SPHI|nr:hypothetical protein [Mucilaginibacter galii]GGI50139.1 hypothetical protein GCM10011425_13510 [Mucilaginibacter galii]